MILFYGILTLFGLGIVRVCLALRNVRRNTKLLKKNGTIKQDALIDIVVVIPVLWEQKIIEETVEHFFKLNYPAHKLHILIVTTEKEYVVNNTTTTIDLIKKLKDKYPFLKRLHYPQTDGQKAEQMNFAIDSFNKVFPALDPGKTFFAFYDADSRPDPDIPAVFSAVYNNNRQANVFQQSAAYLQNFSKFEQNNFFEQYILKSQALRQTYFTLAYEIPRILRVFDYTSQKKRSLLHMVTYAPTISHGLFVRVSFLNTVRFPPNYTPEDMFWGFLVSAMKEPIVFIPSLDRSETPNSIKKLSRQLASWFKGPALGFNYKNFLKDNYPGKYRTFRLRANLMGLFAVYDAVKWFLTSLIVYIYIAGIFMFGWPALILFLVFLIIYEANILMIVKHYLPGTSINATEKLKILFFSLILLLLYSIPTYVSLIHLLCGKKVTHKTER